MANNMSMPHMREQDYIQSTIRFPTLREQHSVLSSPFRHGGKTQVIDMIILLCLETSDVM